MGGYLSSNGGSAPVQSTNLPTNNAESNNNNDTVVIPIDKSQQAEEAFEWYMKHVHRAGHVVRILHVPDLPRVHPYYPEHTFKTEAFVAELEKSENEAVQLIEKYNEKLRQYTALGSAELVSGKPGEAVVAYADKVGASHIVMGTRGFGLLRRTILGSVSEYVIHHTKVPVTVVPQVNQNVYF